MPYKYIHWIKLELRLLDDHRFFLMSEKAQLIFIKLLLLCGKTRNKIPTKIDALNALLRTSYDAKDMVGLLKEIRTAFPKLLERNGFYSIRDFDTHIHWVLKGNSQGTPRERPGIAPYYIREDKSKNKIREEGSSLKKLSKQDPELKKSLEKMGIKT